MYERCYNSFILLYTVLLMSGIVHDSSLDTTIKPSHLCSCVISKSCWTNRWTVSNFLNKHYSGYMLHLQNIHYGVWNMHLYNLCWCLSFIAQPYLPRQTDHEEQGINYGFIYTRTHPMGRAHLSIRSTRASAHVEWLDWQTLAVKAHHWRPTGSPILHVA